MNDLRKRAERNGKVKSIELKIEQTIKKLERMKDEYIQKAVQAKSSGETASYNLAKSAINASLTQIKRAKEMLLNIRITAELQKMGDVNADFLKGMSVISKRISKVNRQSDFVKLQKEINKALSGMAEAQAGLDGFLNNSEAAFASIADAKGALSDEKLDEYISGKVSEKELLIDDELNELESGLKVATSSDNAEAKVSVGGDESSDLSARPFPSPNGTFDFSSGSVPADTELSEKLGIEPLKSPAFESKLLGMDDKTFRSVNTVITGGLDDSRAELIHTYICSCFLGMGSDRLKILIADLSDGGFSCYNGAPQMAADALKTAEELSIALREAEHEIERRFGLLGEAGARDIEEYNSKSAETLPYIAVVIDGCFSAIADETKDAICRIARNGEQTGVYTVIGADDKNGLSSSMLSVTDACVSFVGGEISVNGVDGVFKPAYIDKQKRAAVCTALGRDRL